MSYDLGHNKHTITIEFIGCESQNSQILDEIRDFKLHVEGNNLQNKPSCFKYATYLRYNYTKESV